MIGNRGHRLGRTRPYLVVDVIHEKSVDEDVWAAYQKRMNFVDYLVTKGVARAA